MDYDDLLIFFRQILSKNRELRGKLGQQYSHVMVDEYQDTNGIQADIVRWLASDHKNIMVVGDDSQSVYSFRGANYKNMFEFPQLFENTKIIKLEENYRSTQPILSFTNSLMDQAAEKYTKCLFTKREGGSLPKVINVKTDPEQARFIYQSISEFLNQGISLKEMAVLFRAAYHSFELELALTREGIPFVKYGGFKFMESAHIKDLLAHLRVVLNINDSVSWGRILRLIKNIGQRKSESIIRWMQNEKKLPWMIHEWPGTGKNNDGLNALSRLLKEISAEDIMPDKAVQLVNTYYDPILKERFDDFPRRQKDLDQLVIMAGREKKLKTFLDDLMLDPPTSNSDILSEQREDFLTLSTVHSAKGLEWSVVFIIWVMDGYFPSSKSHANLAAIEEERRLMYVAATRAKDQLILCYPGQEELPIWQLAEIGYRQGLSSLIQTLPGNVMEHISPDSTIKNHYQQQKRRLPVHRPSGLTKPKDPSKLNTGDRVRHPAFGMGVISRFISKEKVEVLFRDVGRKLLHLEYTTLEKV
jgi:DNA helicase-2/ATP-dependent DNA helicase PcrA